VILQPKSASDLAAQIRSLAGSQTRIAGVDLGAFSSVAEYAPEDMTITAGTGMTLQQLQAIAGENRQWLPIDPPFSNATLGEIISANLSGPRRFGYGTIRDYLLGMQVVTGYGEVIRSGGRVVKNVAGYDLAKLFIGSGLSLGVVTEVCLMLRPMPEISKVFSISLPSLAAARQLSEKILESNIAPVSLDLYRDESGLTLETALEGFAEDVAGQSSALHGLGDFQPANYADQAQFFCDGLPIRKISVLPSKVFELIQELDLEAASPFSFAARVGNGLLYAKTKDIPLTKTAPGVIKLSQRLKAAFDPHGLLPNCPE
jgi:FAD/FMN-containing dehydrogenase